MAWCRALWPDLRPLRLDTHREEALAAVLALRALDAAGPAREADEEPRVALLRSLDRFRNKFVDADHAVGALERFLDARARARKGGGA